MNLQLVAQTIVGLVCRSKISNNRLHAEQSIIQLVMQDISLSGEA